jgi:hypothetical protein
MSTIFIPRNKKIKESGCSLPGADFLRCVINQANISGMASYTSAKEARRYANELEKHYGSEDKPEPVNAWIDFFRNCQGFWQR